MRVIRNVSFVILVLVILVTKAQTRTMDMTCSGSSDECTCTCSGGESCGGPNGDACDTGSTAWNACRICIGVAGGNLEILSCSQNTITVCCDSPIVN
jgi:hypothetical protein